MIEHLLSLRFTAGESLLAGLAVGAIVMGIAHLVGALLRERSLQLTTAAPRTVIEFPRQPGAWLRDVDDDATDALYSLDNLIRHGGPQGHVAYYSVQTKRAMAHRWPDKAFHHARMAASLAFALHPELRDLAEVERRFVQGTASRPVVGVRVAIPFRSTERVH